MGRVDKLKAIILLMVFARLERDRGRVKTEELARATGLKDRQVRNYLAYWRELGLVEGRKKRGYWLTEKGSLHLRDFLESVLLSLPRTGGEELDSPPREPPQVLAEALVEHEEEEREEETEIGGEGVIERPPIKLPDSPELPPFPRYSPFLPRLPKGCPSYILSLRKKKRREKEIVD